MPMDLKPPGLPPVRPRSLIRFQVGVAGGLVVALLLLLAQKGFLPI
jgi:hypothetical protein